MTAPSSEPEMIRFWKTKNMTATGMVMRTAAASLSGYRFPDPNAPVNRPATPVVRVLGSGLDRETAVTSAESQPL